MLNKKLILSLFLITPFAAYADIPTECPDVTQIIQVGLNKAHQAANTWGATYYPTHHYGTNFEWNFWLTTTTDTNTKGDEAALEKALAILPSLKFQMGPIHDASTFMCSYTTSDAGIVGTLWYPPLNPDHFE